MNAEETALRLKEATAKCLSSLEAWNKNLKDVDARETLQDAVHELRKVASRLEIDIAMNDRKVTNAKPIPIPEHKSKVEKKSHKPLSEILPVAEIRENNQRRKIEIEDSGDENDAEEPHQEDGKSSQTEQKQRRPRRKKREDGTSKENS